MGADEANAAAREPESPDEEIAKFTVAITKVATLMAKLISEDISRVMENANVLEKVVIRIFGNMVQHAALPYISCSIMLALNGIEVNRKTVTRVLESLGINPSENMLKMVDSLKFKSTIAYSPALYYLRVCDKEVTIDNILKVVKAMGAEPDESIARHTIDLESGKIEPKVNKSIYEQLNKGMIDSAAATGRLLIAELHRTFEVSNVMTYMRKGFLYYLAAVGALAFIGKDIKNDGTLNVNGMLEMVKSIGVTPDKEVVDFVLTLNYGTAPAIYVSAAYFIGSVGKKPTVENITKVVHAMGIYPDIAMIGYVLTFTGIGVSNAGN